MAAVSKVERDAAILTEWLSGKSCPKIAADYGISKSRVPQIISRHIRRFFGVLRRLKVPREEFPSYDLSQRDYYAALLALQTRYEKKGQDDQV